MDKLLFSHSYFMRFDPKQWATGQPYPPLATIGAAALMREQGYKVSLFDTMFVESPESLAPHLETKRPDFFIVYDDGFNYLTKMCLTNMRNAAFRMIQMAHQQGCIVIVSSSDSTDHYASYLEKGADFVLLGEGEETLLQLVTAIRNGDDKFQGISGLAFKQQGLPVQTAARKVMKDLDHLPLPAWDLVDIEQYRRIWMEHHGYFSLNVSTTRGCPFKCNWCAKPIYGNRYNARSPWHVVSEIRMLKERYRFDHIWMCDDIFGLKPGWVNDFADLVEKEGLRFKFKIQSRADLLLQENYVKALARAGCENSWMGAESGSQKILDAMDKGTTVNQIGEATRLLREHGIRPSFFIQFGYPGETKEDIAMTIKMINHLLPDSLGISVSYPLPGTVFYDRVKSELSEKTNWTDSDELKLMFRNTYPPAFYKQLHRYVHRSYGWHLALRQIGQLLLRPARLTKQNFRLAASIIYQLPAAIIARQKLKKLEHGN
ncbi:radical SAM protein [Puia sp.]|uniref:B12-binding domain-containing radical SAM protein n=1 Tax=Puia sp. TaxID=2045100 RepID=UPI002F3E218F